MIKLPLIFFTLILLVVNSSGQVNTKDSIMVKGNAMSGLKFYQNGKRINLEKIAQLSSHKLEAFNYIQKAKTNNVFAFIFAFAGGFVIGWEFGGTLNGKTVDWGVVGAGIGSIGLSVPFSMAGVRNAKKGIAVFNSTP
jgi:hypothetical protein